MIRLNQIHCHIDDQRILEHVSLNVARATRCVVEGARGAGKSVLLAIAAGLRRPESGDVILGGRSIMGLQNSSMPFVRRNIGYLPQRAPFFAGESALENVLMPLAIRGICVRDARQEAEEAMDTLGVAECADTNIDALSGSEQRLVALARALVGSPAAVILDDPLTGLDASDQEMAIAVIRLATNAGSAVLCACNNPADADALLQDDGRRLMLDDGRIIGGDSQMHLVDDNAAKVAAQ